MVLGLGLGGVGPGVLAGSVGVVALEGCDDVPVGVLLWHAMIAARTVAPRRYWHVDGLIVARG